MTLLGDAKPEQITMPGFDGEDRETLYAKAMMGPIIRGSATFKTFAAPVFQNEEIPLAKLAEELSEQAKALESGSLKRAESILLAQAHSLDAIFNLLAQRSAMNIGSHLPAAETYMKLALKAQSQCRTTLETLANIKNPPVVFAKQANIAHGHQQINNGVPAPARAGETENPPTQLLEQTNGERLDFGATATAVGNDPAMATVGEIDRTQDGGR